MSDDLRAPTLTYHRIPRNVSEAVNMLNLGPGLRQYISPIYLGLGIAEARRREEERARLEEWAARALASHAPQRREPARSLSAPHIRSLITAWKVAMKR